jgi:hypothetical protein
VSIREIRRGRDERDERGEGKGGFRHGFRVRERGRGGRLGFRGRDPGFPGFLQGLPERGFKRDARGRDSVQGFIERVGQKGEWAEVQGKVRGVIF